MTPFRAVVFDLDGTLFDHHGASRAAVDSFVTAQGVDPTDEIREAWFSAERQQFEEFRAGRITFAEQRRRRLRQALPSLGRAVPADDDALDELFGHYVRAYRRAWRAFSDSWSVLEALRRAGLRIGILTNGNEDQQLDKLESLGLAALVDVVCTSERLGVAKPDARAFHAVAAELGIRPTDCLFVGDDPEHDIAGATAAGMIALQVTPGHPGGRGLEAVLDLVYRASPV